MNEMSKLFNQALNVGAYDLGFSIDLYSQEVINNPKNFAAFNNRGVSKFNLAIEQGNQSLVEDAKNDFVKAIHLANEIDKEGYPIAESNLKWADTVIAEMSK